MKIEDSVDRMISEMFQLREKKGPYYDKWLKNYSKWITTHAVKMAEHYKQRAWLEGVQAFVNRQQTKENKKD